MIPVADYHKTIGRILNAFEFSAQAHRHQRRKNSSGEPYINHPISVATKIWSIGSDFNVDAVIGAILHDTVEDTDTSLGEIQYRFGENIAQIVSEVSDDKSLSKVERKKLQIVHAKDACKAAKLVKLSDKLDNLSSLVSDPPVGWSESVKRGYFVWSWFVIRELRGTSSFLEEELDRVFRISGFLPCTDPNSPDGLRKMEQALNAYYEELQEIEDRNPKLVVLQPVQSWDDDDPTCRTEPVQNWSGLAESVIAAKLVHTEAGTSGFPPKVYDPNCNCCTLECTGTC